MNRQKIHDSINLNVLAIMILKEWPIMYVANLRRILIVIRTTIALKEAIVYAIGIANVPNTNLHDHYLQPILTAGRGSYYSWQ